MLQMSEKLSEAGLAVPRPARTTFPDGRMATKEAWNYCKAVCKKRKLKAPTLRTFKWHLKHGNLIKAGQVPNPFGGAGPDKVYAISVEAVDAFVSELRKNPNELHVVEQTPHNRVVRRTTKNVKQPPPVDDRELTFKEAFAYVHKKVQGRSVLNASTFELYFVYDVISSRIDERRSRLIRVGDLDAFLDLAPDGVYANHIEYKTAPSRGPDMLTTKQAYEYYKSVDPNPITMENFRAVVAAGIVSPVRTANSPKALIVGFEKQEINAFLALRQRLQEQKAKAPKEEVKVIESPSTPKVDVAKMMAEALVKAKPRLEAAQAVDKKLREAKHELQAESEPEPPSESRFVPTKEAYAYYRERAKRALTDSWFRDKVYRSSLFRTRVEKDVRPNNPSGKKYLVDLDSVDEYLARDPSTKPKPQKAWPVEKAYHKFEKLIPPGLSLIQFKRLVNTGLIRSFTRSSVVHVRLDAVESYFKGLDEQVANLQMGPAYDYYCSKCLDPVTKAHFSRWVASGDIPGAIKEEGAWTINMSCIDDFLVEHPSGRMRTNKNSRVASEARTPKRKHKVETPEELLETENSSVHLGGAISVSLRDYESPEEMKKALETLTSQGFQVVVKP